MVSGRGRNLPARKIKRATKTKGWTPQIRGREFGQRCFFLSDRNSASFPGYCKTRVQILLVHSLFSTKFKISPSQSEIPTLDIPLLTSKPDTISMVI